MQTNIPAQICKLYLREENWVMNYMCGTSAVNSEPLNEKKNYKIIMPSVIY